MAGTRRAVWFITSAIIALALASSAASGSPERFQSLYDAGRYDDAARVAEQLATDDPASWAWAYNTACAYALAGDAQSAGKWLEQTAARGFTGIATVENEGDFDAIRDDPAFKRGVQAVRDAARARFDRFKQAAMEAQPVIIEPKDAAEGPLPLVIALHGTGGDGKSMAGHLRDVTQELGAILVAPDALRPARGGRGFSWTFRDESEWYVLHLIDSLVEQGKADPNRIVLLGFSQGANIAMVMARTHPERFAGVVPVSGHYEHDIAAMPAGDTGPRPRMYLMIGARDEWAHTYEQGERAFKDAGYPCERRVLPRRGHVFPTGASGERELARALEWVLEPAPSAEPAEGGSAP